MVQQIKGTHQGVEVRVEFNDDVYHPGPLTFALCDLMRFRPGDRVVDAGCGTGYLGLVAALLGAGEVICTDPVEEALRWTRHNARLNGLNNVIARRGGELEPLAGEEADLILTLPPQMPLGCDFNPWRYGGPDGCDVIMSIIRQAPAILSPRGGRMYLVHSALANPRRVREALDRTTRSWAVVATIEKEWDRDEASALHPDLYDYVLAADRRGQAELERRAGRFYYPVWFYHLRY